MAPVSLARPVSIRAVRDLESRLITLRRLLVKYGHLDEVLALDEAWGEFGRTVRAHNAKEEEARHAAIPPFRAHQHPELFPQKQFRERDVTHV